MLAATATPSTINTLTTVDYLVAILAFGAMVGKSVRSNIKDYKKTGDWNWTRTILALIFSMNLLKFVFRFVFFSLNVEHPPWMVTEDITEMSVGSSFSGFMVAFGLTFVFYVNRRDYLLYGPLVFYAWSLFFYTQTGVATYHVYFMYIGGAITIVTIYQAGFALKDNDALGLGIVYTFVFVAAVLQDPLINPIIDLVAYAFVFLLVFDKFQPYKEEDLK